MSFIRRVLTKIREIKTAHQDAKQSRVCVGTDRYNNRHYQYYDRNGNETKRIVENARKFADDEVDLYWSNWLKHIQIEPPTPEMLKELYEEEEKFREAVYSYEKRDAEMMAKYRKEMAKKAKEQNQQTTQAQGFGKEFEPGKWDPTGKNK